MYIISYTYLLLLIKKFAIIRWVTALSIPPTKIVVASRNTLGYPKSQVEVGDYSPTTPTDPDVQISRIRFLSLWFR